METAHGRVRGLVRYGVNQFYGVPYGASTAGANRFMPPVKPAAWTGVRDCFQVANRAPQDPDGPISEVFALDRREPMGEDCLAINVFTPGLGAGNRPVMVWLHGGGFSGGSGNWLLYDGTNLARKEDVVVVSVNHRLNLFGFLHLAGPRRRREVEPGEQRRDAGHRRGAGVGEGEHRGLRRQPGQRHRVRPVGRRRQGHDADGDAGGQGAVPPRDRDERIGASRRDARKRDARARSSSSPSWG